MEYNLQGILNLRDAIVKLACHDYVEAKKYLIKTEHVDIPKDLPEVSPNDWITYKNNYKAGKISKEEFDTMSKYKKLNDIKKRCEKSLWTIHDLERWFDSDKFTELCVGVDCDTVIYNLNKRVHRELEEEARLKRKKKKKKKKIS